jgi:hypothetical protein
MFTAAPRDLSRHERKEYQREQRDALKAAVHERFGREEPDDKIASRISRFRRALIAYPATALGLLVINASTGGPPWFLFPAAGLSLALLLKAGWLWGEGVSFRQVFVTPPRRKSGTKERESLPVPRRDENELATHEILAGPYGPTIRRASASREIIADVLRRLTTKERELLPKDLEATVDALVDRVASVGTTLHRLDADANGSHLGSLDDRIAGLQRDPPSSERDRRLSLLERQRATLRDLLERRGALLTQLESASMALETLKLDLVRFRSAGVSTALEDVTSATREARAVSRDIEHLLDAQDEVRRM